MITEPTLEYAQTAFAKRMLKAQKANEKAEVILRNLLRLKNKECNGFIVEFDDVVVTIEAAIEILESK